MTLRIRGARRKEIAQYSKGVQSLEFSNQQPTRRLQKWYIAVIPQSQTEDWFKAKSAFS
jgi:hypothetical protein